jgi:pyruvate/2-oxoglutarate dehydrogenase complex dihydrolipoamide acyltransferase (E2) component
MSARVASTPLARKLARAAGIALSQIRGSGPGGRVVAADLASTSRLLNHPHPSPLPQAGEGVRGARSSEPSPACGRGQGEGGAAAQTLRIASTPYARRLARARRIDLARVRGSGPDGRIVARDVERSMVLTVEIATEAPAALCAHLNRTLAKGTPPITVSDVVTKAAARVLGGTIAWTVDGIRPAWAVADAARLGLAAIARARMAGVASELPHAPLLRVVASRERLALTIAFPPGENRDDSAAVAARIRDTVAWPPALLL